MKKIITSAVLFVLGIAALLFGIFYSGASLSKKADIEIRIEDVVELKDDNIGQSVKLKLTEEQQWIDENNYLAFCGSDERETLLRITVGDEFAGNYKRLVENGISVIGIVRASTEDIAQGTYDAAVAYYDMLSEYTGMEVTDELKDSIRNSISPYYLEITDVAAVSDIGTIYNIKLIACAAGAVLILAAFIVLVSILTKKAIWKIALIFVGIVIVLAIIAVIILLPKIKLMSGIRKDGDGVYYMEYTDKLKFDDMLAANISSDDDLFAWVSGAEFYNLPINMDINRYGCASFSAKSPDGNVLFGRNFDYGETDTLIVHSKPTDGYSFYGVADLYVIGISKEPGCIDPDSLLGRFLMLAAPYVICDGINEAGLGVSTHQLNIGELHQDTGKPDLFVYTSIPLILERCTTVDEAVSLLDSYDIHSHNGNRQHLFIVDKTGRSAVVEWIDDKMYVNELNAVTNSVVTPGEHYDECADWRLPVITAALAEHNDILTKEQAKELLDAASQKDYTEWSCVYDLDDFCVDVYVDEDYTQAYHYGGKN